MQTEIDDLEVDLSTPLDLLGSVEVIGDFRKLVPALRQVAQRGPYANEDRAGFASSEVEEHQRALRCSMRRDLGLLRKVPYWRRIRNRIVDLPRRLRVWLRARRGRKLGKRA